jgi:hypothetical protein
LLHRPAIAPAAALGLTAKIDALVKSIPVAGVTLVRHYNAIPGGKATRVSVVVVCVYDDMNRCDPTWTLLLVSESVVAAAILRTPPGIHQYARASIIVVAWTSLARNFPNATTASDNPPMHQNLFRVVVRRVGISW